MASGNFSGDPVAMQAAAQNFASALSDLNTYVRPVQQGSQELPWTGQAANQYQQLLIEWLAQFNTICQGLETMQTALVGTASGYGDSEDWAMQAVNSAAGLVGGPSPLQQSLGMV